MKKNKNSHISVAFRANLTKFGLETQFDPLHRSDYYKFEISKIQDGGGRHLKKSKNYHISAAVRAILTTFGTLMQFGSLQALDRSDRLKFESSKSQNGGGRHLEKSNTDISPPWFERFRQNLAQ